MAVNMTITPGPDSLGPVGQTLSVYNKRTFSYTFTPSVSYTIFQAFGTASADFNTTTGVFSNPNGYSPVGTQYSLTVDALAPITDSYSSSVLAGSGVPGYTDDVGILAEFNTPRGIAVNSSGVFYIADADNYVLRRVTPSGIVTTLAGSPGISGFTDGTGGFAQFGYLGSLAIDPSGNVYAVDETNYAIRKISPTGVVTTLAGNGTGGDVDGTGVGATLGTIGSITYASDGNIYITVSWLGVSKIKKITAAGVVTTFYTSGTPMAGISGDSQGRLYVSTNTSILQFSLPSNIPFTFYSLPVLLTNITTDVYGNVYGTNGQIYRINGDGSFTVLPTPQTNLRQFVIYNTQTFAVDSVDCVLYTLSFQVDVRPSAPRPSGNVVVSSSYLLTVQTISRITSSETPPVVGGIAQLYKYEPFSYTYSTPLSGDSFVLTTSPEVLAFTTSNSSNVAFQSVPGFQSSYNNAFPFNLQVFSNSVLQESRSYNVQVGAGRFFPPTSGSSYILYQNETISPIELDTCASMTQTFSSPSIPVGLSIVPADTCGNIWNIQGTPTIRSVGANYQLIGQNTTNGRVVSTSVNITVSGERIRLYVNDVFDVPIVLSNMAQGVPITPQVITAQYPGPPAFSYQWAPSLLDGLRFTDVCGNTVTTPFVPTDSSQSIILTGTPTSNALSTLTLTGGSNYIVSLVARQLRPSANLTKILPCSFSFVENVLFRGSPYSKSLFVGLPITVSDNIYFEAKTYFGNNEPIVNIFSPDLRTDLSISFNPALQRGYLVSSTGPLSIGSNTFTLRAINSSGIVGNTALTIQSIADTITWNYAITPAIDTCYNFIYSRSLADSKIGYYPSPIQFSAQSAAGQPIVYTITGVGSTGITIVGNTLTGVPFAVAPLSTATIRATALNTTATSTTRIRYTVLDDVITLSGAFPTQFYQNIPLTPAQLSATVLSDRSITLYTATDLPAGTYITPTGVIAGTPTQSDVSGVYTIEATTGYKVDSISIPYSLTPDAIVFLINPTRYYIPPGSNVPSNIRYSLLSFSGTNVSNTTILPTNPTTFGVTINSTGVFGGTMSTCIPPDPIVPNYPQSVPYTVTASAGFAAGSTSFVISSLNGNGARRYATVSNVLYYTVPTDLTYSPPSTEYNNYIGWYPTTLTLSSGCWTSAMVSIPTTISGATVVVAANNVTTGYLKYSLDGVTFSNATTPANSIITNVARYGSTWYGAGVTSGTPHMFRSLNGINWSNVSTIPISTRTGTANAYETYGLALSVNPSNGTIFVGGGSGVISTNGGTTWTSSSLLSGEIAGAYSRGLDFLVYGSEYYTTSGGISSFVPSPTMRGSYNNGPTIVVPGEFNAFCYDVVSDPSGTVYLATGVQYDGTGYVPQMRASSSLYGPYDVVDLSSNPLFTPTVAPPKPPIGIGPIFFDNQSVHVFVRREVSPGSNVLELYIHDIELPLTNWIVRPEVFFQSTTSVPRITTLSDAGPFSVDSNCLPYLDFTPGGDPNNPPPGPIITSPLQSSFLVYQYIPIDPIIVSAVPALLGGGPVYIFVQISDLPRGLQYNKFTKTIYGTPVQEGLQTLKIYAVDVSTGAYTLLVLSFNVLIPRIIRRQDGAGAYTSLLRNYVEVNGAQNSRDTRVFAGAGDHQGVFGAPNPPSVQSAPEVNPKCCEP